MSDESMTADEALDEILIQHLVAMRTHEEAAHAASCSTKTVQRRLADPEFSAELGRRRALHVAALTAKVCIAEDRAVDVVLEVMETGKDEQRLRAAALIHSWSGRLRRETDVDARLTLLEQRKRGSGRKSRAAS